MAGRSRSWWGWGWADSALSDSECATFGKLLPNLPTTPLPVPRVADAELPAPRLDPPRALAPWCSQSAADRAAHTYGKSYRDVVRALRADLSPAPDIVAFPRNEQHIIEVLEWATSANAAIVPYGAGSSVVGGVEYRGAEHTAVICVDTSRMDQVLEVDNASRAARIQAGAPGPVIEEQLHPHGYTLGHFPHSFEFSTLGGWLATRATGHHTTAHTRIDDLVESLRIITPSGPTQTPRTPTPAPHHPFLGCEGTLGVITEAWIRLRTPPHFTSAAAILFSETSNAVAALRDIAQSEPPPTSCRLLGPGEALFHGVAQDGRSVLLLGCESTTAPVDWTLAHAVEIARGHHGTPKDSGGEELARSWHSALTQMPYIRDGLTRMSAIVESFETTCTWDAVHELCAAVLEELAETLTRVCGVPGIVNWRFTHAHPDGAAPYFTVIASGKRGSEIAMWEEIHHAAAEILHRHGATITHHNATGRDHRAWHEKRRPRSLTAAMAATKHHLDPDNILNPGALVSPQTAVS